MKLATVITLLLFAGSAFAQATPTATPTAAFDFPNAPTQGQSVNGPSGQALTWDGRKWVAVGGASGSYAPLVNISGGVNNYAPINAPSFTGLTIASQMQVANTLSAPTANFGNTTISSGSVLMMAGSAALYFNGIPPGGTCGAGNAVTSISATIIPTCSPVATGGPFLPLTGGTLNGPGNLTVNGTLTQNGNAQFGGGATVSFGLQVPNYISVNGPATFNGTTTLNGTVTFPSSSTATTAGFNNVVALGVGVAAPAAGRIQATSELLTTETTTGNALYFGPSTTAPYGTVLSNQGTTGYYQTIVTAGAHSVAAGWQADSVNPVLSQLADGSAGSIPGIFEYVNAGATVGSTFTPNLVGSFTQYGLNLPAYPPTGYATLTLGPVQSPNGSISYGSDGQLRMQGGATFSNGQWIKTHSAGLTGATLFQTGANSGGDGVSPGMQLYINSGLTDGASFTPKLYLEVNQGSEWLLGTDATNIGMALGWVESGQSVVDPTMVNWPGPAGTFNETIAVGAHASAPANWISDDVAGVAIGMSRAINFYAASGQTIGSLTNWRQEASLDSNAIWLDHVAANQAAGAPTVGTGESLYPGSRDSLGAATGPANTIDLYFARSFTSGPTCVVTYNGQPNICYNSIRNAAHVQFACVAPGGGPVAQMDITYFCFAEN